MEQDQRLDGKVAIVTGGSRGIGRAIAARLARAGARVMIASRDAESVDRAVAEIGAQAAGVAVDLRDADGGARLVEAAIVRFGRLDILVNNAGDTKFGPFESLTDEDFQNGFGLKYFAAVRCARAALPHLRQTKGVILQIAGVGGRLPGADFAIGGSVNAALQALTKSLAALGQKDGVRALAINPGSVLTDRLKTAIAAWAERDGLSAEAMQARVAQDQDITRIGEPEDVAALAAFLVSPGASWMTGSLVDIDGGMIKVI